MDYRKITAFIAADSLKAVEEALRHLNLAGEIAISHINGYDEHKDLYNRVTYQARVEVFVPAGKTEQVVAAIMHAAHTGLDTDGIIAVLPVESLYSIKDRTALHGP